jgi:uncharacterized membrane protein YsdA (DUF1294 family)
MKRPRPYFPTINSKLWSYVSIAFFLCLLLMLLAPWLLVNWLVAINLTTLFAFYEDKQSAIHKRRRVPEKTLIALALLGGAPATFISKRLFRHKTQDTAFNAWLYTLLAIQALVAASILLY